MYPLKISLILFLLFTHCVFAEKPKQSNPRQTYQAQPRHKGEKPDIEFENEDTLIDVEEGVRSEQYVRRSILSTAIKTSTGSQFSRFYINHLIGFSSVYQKLNITKYTSGMQGISLGYVSTGGHCVEAGLELSAVSNVFGGYRYVIRPGDFLIWPFLGVGFGQEVNFFTFADGPAAARAYNGRKQHAFGTFGFLIPLVDVALKAEFRLNAYGTDRLILTQGIGAVIFL